MEFEYMEFEETVSNTHMVAQMMGYLGYEVERGIDMPIIRVTDEYVGHAADWRLVNGRISAITMYAGRCESSLWHELCHHHQPILRQGVDPSYYREDGSMDEAAYAADPVECQARAVGMLAVAAKIHGERRAVDMALITRAVLGADPLHHELFIATLTGLKALSLCIMRRS